MENSINYLLLNNNYIINMTAVNVMTYSNSSSTSGKSTIVLRESSVSMLSQQTRYNILKTTDLNTTIVSNANSNYLLDSNKNIVLYMTSFSINNFSVLSEYASINSDYSMIKAYLLGSKQVWIQNMFFQISGGIFKTTDPLNMTAKNIVFDMYQAQYAIVIYATCNYPEAILNGGLYVDNFTIYDSQSRVVSLTDYVVVYSGPGNMIVNKFNCSVYAEFPSNSPIMGIYSINECDPSTSVVQYGNITNSYLTMPENPNLIRHAVYLLNAASGVNGRPAITAFKNNYFENIYLSLWPPFWAGSLPTIPTYTENNYYKNCSSQTFVNRIEGITIFMNNDTFDTSYGNTNYILYIGFPPVASIKGVTFKNINGCTESRCISYGDQVLLDALPYASVLIDNLIVKDSIMGPNCFIKIYSNFSGGFTITNSQFTNIQVSSGYPLILTGDVLGATLKNITFQNIYSSNDLDSSNRLIKFTSVNLGSVASFIFNTISVINSTVPFYELSSVSRSSNNNSTLEMTSITYSNCTIPYSQNLISFKFLIQSYNLAVLIHNVEFTYIIFKTGGNIFNFQHQQQNQVVIRDSIFHNLFGCSIHLESYNKDLPSITTNVLISNITTANINGQFGSFIHLNTGGNLQIWNSSLADIFNYETGAVIYAEYENTVTQIYNSVIQNNTAMNGGVFYSQSGSVIKCTNCTITNNFALISAVIYSYNNGFFEFYSCEISNNFALSNPIGQILEVFSESILSNCSIHDNTIINETALVIELSKCSYLCFLNSVYSSQLSSILVSYQNDNVKYGFQVIEGIISFTNSTKVYNQKYLISSFISTASFVNFEISNITSDDSSLKLTSTNVTMQNVKCYNLIITVGVNPLIYLTFDTNFVGDNIVLTNSMIQAFRVLSSSIKVSNLSLSEINSEGPFIEFLDSYDSQITDSIIRDSNSTFNAIINGINANINQIKNLTISNINTGAMRVQKSNIKSIDFLTVTNANSGLFFYYSNITSINNIQISDVGSSSLIKGGAIYCESCNLNIQNSTFSSNKAIYGSAINFDCKVSSSAANCNNSISSTKFFNNSAVQRGGAIFYNSYRPVLSNNSFSMNSAEYGQDIASYAVKIVAKDNAQSKFIIILTSKLIRQIFTLTTIDGLILNSIGSGILYNATLVLELKDFDNQTMNLDNVSQIKISPVISNSKITGIDFARSINGVGSFSSLHFIYKPGEQNVLFLANSKAIDSSLVKSVFGSAISNFSISVNFRYCKPGEYIVSSQECLECSQGTYSLEWNSTSCSTCMNTAVCNGGTEIELNSGYWRRTLNSTDIIDCPRTDSCNGGYYESQEFPVGCAEGYSGYLCTTCVIANGTKFMRVGDYECNLCPNPLYNAIRVVGLLLLIFLFMIFLIIVNIRKRKESQNSILLRIFTNYLQLLATAMSYNLKFPPELVNAFYPVQRVGTTQESFLSFDCFVENTDIKAFTPSTTIFKLFLTALLPLALILLFAVVFIILFLTGKKWFKDIKRNIIISTICILYLLHPTLTKTSLSLFQCTTVDTNMKRVTIEMTIECYSSTHLFWAFAVGIPMIVVWVLGMPAVMLYILIKNRNKLNDDSVKKYYLIIYQGLRHDIFYWEFINVIRKVILYVCNVLLSTYNGFYRASVSIVFLVILFRLQIKLKPYKFEQNNMIEMLAINCGMITLFGGIIFIEQTNTSVLFLQMFALVFILLINIYFILKWTHLFVYSYNTKHYAVEMVRKVLSFVLIIERKVILELQDKIQTTTSKFQSEMENKLESKSKNKKKHKIKKRVDFTKRKQKTKDANTFKDTERRLKTPNQFEAFSQFEEEKMGIDHLENAFELFSESKNESDKRIIRNIIEKSSFLNETPKDAAVKPNSKFSSFKVKLRNKANKHYSNNSESILEIVAEDKELNQDEDDTKRKLNISDLILDSSEGKLKRTKKKKNLHKP